jgi:hypothetical protein
MMRNDTMNCWNLIAQFLLGDTASEVAVTFSRLEAQASRYNPSAVSSLQTGMSKGND